MILKNTSTTWTDDKEKLMDSFAMQLLNLQAQTFTIAS
jgi:hypothetical protein